MSVPQNPETEAKLRRDARLRAFKALVRDQRCPPRDLTARLGLCSDQDEVEVVKLGATADDLDIYRAIRDGSEAAADGALSGLTAYFLGHENTVEAETAALLRRLGVEPEPVVDRNAAPALTAESRARLPKGVDPRYADCTNATEAAAVTRSRKS